MNPNPEVPGEQDDFNSYDPFTSRGPDYDDAWAPPGDRYERNIDDRYGRLLDFTDLDYVDEDAGEEQQSE